MTDVIGSAPGESGADAAPVSLETFIRRNTAVQRAPLVPEIALRLASDSVAIFQAAEKFDRAEPRMPPFWSYAWPGGQAMARHLLDHRDEVAGRRVVDIGAGSGISSVAAAFAGARSVLAADIDPLAEAAIRLNAGINDATIRTTVDDLLSGAVDADIVLIGDLVYEPELATRVAAFLDSASRAGTAVLLADRTTARRPPGDFHLVAEHPAPVCPELPGSPFEAARVWRLNAAGAKRRNGRR